jgi:hypothetical protein
VARPGQPQRLGALAGADVQDAEPAAGVRARGLRETRGDLLVDLAGDQFLPDGVPQPAQLVEPALGAAAEAVETTEAGGSADTADTAVQSLVPRLTCGLGSRSRRIWSVRIRP